MGEIPPDMCFQLITGYFLFAVFTMGNTVRGIHIPSGKQAGYSSQKRHRCAASCGFYRLATSCQQIAASQLTSSSCSKSVKIRLAAT